MIREAELEEMEKKWREDNERIMREYPGRRRLSRAQPVMTSLPPSRRASPTCRCEAPAAPDDDPTPPTERPLP